MIALQVGVAVQQVIGLRIDRIIQHRIDVPVGKDHAFFVDNHLACSDIGRDPERLSVLRQGLDLPVAVAHHQVYFDLFAGRGVVCSQGVDDFDRPDVSQMDQPVGTMLEEQLDGISCDGGAAMRIREKTQRCHGNPDCASSSRQDGGF